MTDPSGKVASYEYDNLSRIVNVSKNNGQENVTNSYEYENDYLKTVTHNGFSYSFVYDEFGNQIGVKAGSQNLIINVYEQFNKSGTLINTGKLLESQYGNNQKVSYEYDELDRVKAIKFANETKFTYDFDANGNTGYHQDFVNGTSFRYIYDFADRLSKIKQNNGDSISYDYDLNNNVRKTSENIGDKQYETNYEFDKDNRQNSVVYSRTFVNLPNIEYFLLNGDLKGSKGTEPTSENAVFEPDDTGTSVLTAFESTKNVLPTNSSFENGSTGWTLEDWSGSTGKWRVVSDGVHGSSSLESYDSDGLTDGSATNGVAYQWYTLPSALTAAKPFTLSAFAKRMGLSQPAQLGLALP